MLHDRMLNSCRTLLPFSCVTTAVGSVSVTCVTADTGQCPDVLVTSHLSQDSDSQIIQKQILAQVLVKQVRFVHFTVIFYSGWYIC